MINHPRKKSIPLSAGLSWKEDGSLYQQKLDGKFDLLDRGKSKLSGENIAGEFIAWDCIFYDGVDVRPRPAAERFQMLEEICQSYFVKIVPCSSDGAKLLEMVLQSGGEGVVRKSPMASYFDEMEACKRIQAFFCRVVSQNIATGGAEIVCAESGERRGIVPLRDRIMLCRVGSIVKIEGLELTGGGKIRDPRPCKDTPESWLVKF